MANRRIEVEIVGDARQLARTFDKAGKSAKGFSSNIGRVAKNIGVGIAAIGAAAAGLGVVTGRAFSRFEESMDRIVGLAGGARDQVKKFSQEILKLGPSVGKGPQELGDALYFVASAGIAVSKQMEVVTRSAKASAAGLGETQVVADAVTSAMNAYGPAVINAAKATDVLVATVREGKGEAATFAPVIGTVAAIAAELGVRFEEVGAALAAQTRLGIGAETAAVNLQAVFSSLLKVTPKTAKALASVGLTHAGLRKELKERGLLSLLKTLKERFGDNTAAMAQSFPNIRALRALLALVGKNAEQVSGVFDRMSDSTGALGIAFGAVSKDEAFKFRQTMAALAVVGIRLGAVFAPVAKVVADGATKALTAISDLIDKLGEAKTVRAKLDVIWTGVTDAARGATDLLGKAVAKIDFDAVWAKARNIADGLQAQLEKVDFGFVGEKLGVAIQQAVDTAIPAAKELGERLNKAFRTIDFEALGRQLGPGLAAAVVTAFLTLTDPAFWLRNWDLALAVAFTAFGGPIGRLAGKIVAPLARLGARIPLEIAAAIERFAPRVASAVLTIFVRLPGLVAKALSPLTGLVARVFGRLGKLTQFTVKVLGILAVINVITSMAKKIGGVFKNLGASIAGAFDKAWERLKIGAIRAALAVVEPFSHLPGRFGGWARDLKDRFNAQLDQIAAHADKTARAIQGSIDSIKGKDVFIRIKTVVEAATTTGGGPQGQQGRGQGRAVAAAAAAAASDAAKVNAQAAESASKAEEDAAKTAASARKRAAAAAEKAATAAKAAAEKVRAAFDALMDSLDLRLDKAEVTARFSDDFAALKAMESAVKAQIKEEGKTIELQRKLFEIRQQRADLLRQQRNAKQFEALNLTDTGEVKLPSAAALKKRLGSLTEQVKGTFLDTSKTGAQLKRIAQVLAGKFGAVGKDVRAAILQMLNDITSALKDGGGAGAGGSGEITRGGIRSIEKLIKGLGLTQKQIEELERRNLGVPSRRGLSAFGFAISGGAGGGGTTAAAAAQEVVIHNHIHLDGREIASSTKRTLQKKGRHSAPSRRGNRGGRSVAL